MTLAHPATWPAPPSLDFSQTLGPFLLEKATTEEQVYVRNPRYHGITPKIIRIENRLVIDPKERLRLFQEGQADIVKEVPNYFLRDLSFATYWQHSGRIIALVFNSNRPPFGELTFRQLFQFSVNPDELSTLLKLQDPVVHQLLPLNDGTSPRWAVRFSPESAKALLTDLPHPLPKIAMEVDSFAGARDIAQNLQAQWLKNLDIKVELVETKYGPVMATPLSLIQWQFDVFKPRWGLEDEVLKFPPLLVHEPLKSDTSKRWEALALQWSEVTTFAEYAALLKQLEQTAISDESFVLPLCEQVHPILVNPHVHGLKMDAAGVWHYDDLSLSP